MALPARDNRFDFKHLDILGFEALQFLYKLARLRKAAMERKRAGQNQFRRGILRGQGHGLHRLIDRRPLRIFGRELRQISLGQADMPGGEIRSHVDQVLEAR